MQLLHGGAKGSYEMSLQRLTKVSPDIVRASHESARGWYEPGRSRAGES